MPTASAACPVAPVPASDPHVSVPPIGTAPWRGDGHRSQTWEIVSVSVPCESQIESAANVKHRLPDSHESTTSRVPVSEPSTVTRWRGRLLAE